MKLELQKGKIDPLESIAAHLVRNIKQYFDTKNTNNFNNLNQVSQNADVYYPIEFRHHLTYLFRKLSSRVTDKGIPFIHKDFSIHFFACHKISVSIFLPAISKTPWGDTFSISIF